MNTQLNISQSLLFDIVESCRRKGAEHAVVFGSQTRSNTIRFALNQITQNLENTDFSLWIAVSVDNREGIISTNILDPDSIEATIDRVIDYARQSPVNEEFVPPIGPQEYPQVKMWFESTAAVTLNDRANQIRKSIEYAEKNDIHLFGNLAVDNGVVAAVNSSGLSINEPFTDSVLHLTARSVEGSGSGVSALHEPDWSRMDLPAAAESAARTALMSRNPVRHEPGDYTVVMAPAALLEYLMFMHRSFDARRAEEGQSIFSDRANGKTKIGTQICDRRVTISSLFNHPEMPSFPFGIAHGSGGSEAGMYFGYGLKMDNFVWIENGVLRRLRDSIHNAIKNNRQPFASPQNVIMNGGSESIDDIIRSTKKGIFISSFWYTSITDINTLDITGLTRDGTFLIEDGRLTVPLMNFRFNDSPIRSLNSLSAIGKPVKSQAEYIQGIVPPVRIEGFHLSSVSGAV